MAAEHQAVVRSESARPELSGSPADAVATYLVRERGRPAVAAVDEARTLVDVMRGFATWFAAQPDERLAPAGETSFEELELPPGFDYFEATATANLPVIDAAPAWQHLDQPRASEEIDSIHAGIVQNVVEDFTNPERIWGALAAVTAIAAVLLHVFATQANVSVSLQTWTFRAIFPPAIMLFGVLVELYTARRLRRAAVDRIVEHDAREHARLWRKQLDDQSDEQPT